MQHKGGGGHNGPMLNRAERNLMQSEGKVKLTHKPKKTGKENFLTLSCANGGGGLFGPHPVFHLLLPE